jgi:cytochrome b6-f complex iron-sulfur subunit
LSTQPITRRKFLEYLTRAARAAGLIAIAGPIIAYFYPSKLEEIPSEPVAVGPAESLPVGASSTVRYGRYPALVINTPDGLRAYSAVCTHFACIVKWEADSGRIMCPCHEGYFDPADGHVLSGPPPRPLDAFPVHITDGQIYIGEAAQAAEGDSQ